MRKTVALVYGGLCYVVFLATFLYAVGFVENLLVPKSVDSGIVGTFTSSLLIDCLLLSAFAIQHSGMARRGFKSWWTRVVPAEAERSTYVLCSSLLLVLLYWQWRPIPDSIWSVDTAGVADALVAVSWLGWGVVLISTCLISHFELFGLRQVWANFSGSTHNPVGFQTPLLYRLVRHPIYLGFVLAFWATPEMSGGHLLFSIATTGYIFVGILFEERDLVHFYGEKYLRYRREVRMMLPLPRRKAAAGAALARKQAGGL